MKSNNQSRETRGGHHPFLSRKCKETDYSISLPILYKEATQIAEKVGCRIEENKIIGTIPLVETFMALQNPMYQSKYNSSTYLNGAWNPLSCKLDVRLPKPQTGDILMSASVLRSDKMVSTGFMPVVYDDFEQLAEAMHSFAHSPSIYSPICRWDMYQNKMKWDYRRRQHNISFIGNIMVYDFDNGTLSFDDAVELMKDNDLHGLLIRSKSDPKYDYDRFKMLVKTDFFFPMYKRDGAPEGFIRLEFSRYKELYIGLAKKYGFWDHADHSTIDPSRLVAQVNNSDHERRVYVTV